MAMADSFKKQMMSLVAEQARAREMAAIRAWDRLTDHEKSLVREAAVMGYVLGQFPTEEHKDEMGREGRPVPRDSSIVEAVLEGALANPDLYPALAGEADEEDGAD
jgi:hypothetical protein